MYGPATLAISSEVTASSKSCNVRLDPDVPNTLENPPINCAIRLVSVMPAESVASSANFTGSRAPKLSVSRARSVGS